MHRLYQAFPWKDEEVVSTLKASGECRQPFRIRSPSVGREGNSGEAEAPRLALTEENIESEGMSGVV